MSYSLSAYLSNCKAFSMSVALNYPETTTLGYIGGPANMTRLTRSRPRLNKAELPAGKVVLAQPSICVLETSDP